VNDSKLKDCGYIPLCGQGGNTLCGYSIEQGGYQFPQITGGWRFSEIPLKDSGPKISTAFELQSLDLII
jgi:hypothetical protein